MKNKLFKITSILTIICMLSTMLIPNMVKSAQTIIEGMQDTNRGVGNTEVWTTQVKGYNNIYCARGGASLFTGTNLNVEETSIFDTNYADITNNIYAVRWLLDNMYLTEGADQAEQTYMKNNLIKIVKEYNAKNNLGSKIGVAVTDEWITNAINSVINDKETLFAVQQYALWNQVKNSSSSYNNPLVSSNGYNKIPNAKAQKEQYIALYISLTEMAKEAQKNRYTSPNAQGMFETTFTKDANCEAVVQNDKKTVLVGPYTISKNHSSTIKTLTATVNNNRAESIQAVNEKGNNIDISNYNGKVYFKFVYNNGFPKGTEYNIKINIALNGYKTSANILRPTNGQQPVVSIRKENYNKALSAEHKFKQQIEGKYSLEIKKVEDNTAISGISFNVKEGIGQTKTYGPTNGSGIIAVETNRKITEPGKVEYIISEVKSEESVFVPLKESFKLTVELGQQNEMYKAINVYFDNGKQTKNVKLESDEEVTLSAEIKGNTVTVTVPNKRAKGNYTLQIRKEDEKGEILKNVHFKVIDHQTGKEKNPITGTDGKAIVTKKTITKANIDEYTVTEVQSLNGNYITLDEELKVYVTTELKDHEYQVKSVSFDKNKVTTSKKVKLEDKTTEVEVKVSYNDGVVTVTIPNKKIEGAYSLDILKVDENGKALQGVNFKIQEGMSNLKTYGPTSSNGVINIINNRKIYGAGIDEYTIYEVNSEDSNYISLNEAVKVYVTKDVKDFKKQATKVSLEKDRDITTKEVTLKDGTKVKVEAKLQNGRVTITVPNKKIEGSYSLELEKVDLSNNNSKMAGATFKVQENSSEAKSYGPTGSNGTVSVVNNKPITGIGTDEYTITEVSVEDKSYITLQDSFKVYVKKEIQNNKYVASKASFEKDKDVLSKQVQLKDGTKVTVSVKLENNKITITVPNKKVTGNYSVMLEKVNSENKSEKISGVTFKVKQGSSEEKQYGPTNNEGIVSIVENRKITKVGTDEYTITEVSVDKEKYIQLKEQFTFYVTKEIQDNSYKATSVSFEKDKEVKTKKVTLEDGTKVTLQAQIIGNTVKITIPNKPIVKQLDFDLALRKYISEVKRDGKTITIGEDRSPVINEFSATEYENNKTAGYYHIKDPVKVKPGDVVVYTIKVYNEGNIDGYAKEITEYLPQGLEYIENSEINKNNKWVVSNVDGKTIAKTNILENVLIPAANGTEGFADYAKSGSKEDPKFSKYVQIECKVKNNIQDSKLLLNVAEITNYGYTSEDGKYIEASKEKVDIDSQENNVFAVKKDITNLDEYYEKNVVPQNKPNNNYYKGIQDDDDFESVYVEPDVLNFKFVLNKVDEQGNPLIGADFTVERFKQDENKVLLNNEEVKGTYEVLEDNVKYNTTYSYKVIEVESAPEYVNVMEGKYITLRTYMNENKQLVLGNYEKIEEEDNLISKYGFIINNTDGTIVKENETDLYAKIKVEVRNNSIPAQVVITIPNALKEKEKEFDLALRKFITAVTVNYGKDDQKTVDVKNRYPQFKIDEKGNYVYEHIKTPVLVANENVVTYTLRVYNEGEQDGYAKLIKDDIPEGLVFMPENELNKTYRWVMLDKEGKETKDASKAAFIVSDYLSKEQEKIAGENLLKAFDKQAYTKGEIKEPEHKEVKVSFKVNKNDKFDEIVINQAQISKHSDKDGNEKVTDKDSTPDKWVDGEDDQDIEKIRVQYFDLALRKWVTKAITVENGIQTVTETGHKAEDDPEQIVKVDLKQSNIQKVKVKFEYSIRVTNEGQIAGYAKEISDYIPEGLKFVKEDNPNWQEVEGKVVTDQLKDKLLQPGESAEVTILLTWINNEKNMGLKVNTAEISKDYNDYGTPDIDSTPNNKVPGEDDIDDAPVMLTVKTGQAITYIGVVAVVLVMIAGSVVAIKKYVIK